MRDDPFDNGRELDLPDSGPGNPLRDWHTVSVSPGSPPPSPACGPEALERCFTELMHYYRHSSAGRRCLGIVHQMNTPLQVLAFQLDLLEQKAREEAVLLEDNSPAGAEALGGLNRYRLEKLGQCRAELDRLRNYARDLVHQGVHEGSQERVSLDLNQLYRQELELAMANPFFKHQVAKELRFGEGIPLFFGHYIDFSQSFRNLLDNALEAMEGTAPRHLMVVTACRGRQITLRLGDTGVGIPPGDLPRIFDPFFTTKRLDGGDRAGLGLFMTWRLLAPYRASIRVDSGPGGTWVTVSVPAV
jgi:two-component system, NtrC family, sensor kinase